MKNQILDSSPIIGTLRHLFLTATVRCYRIENLLSLYIDGQLSDKLTAEVDSHLSECQSCREAKAILSATHQVLAVREPAAPPAYLSERLRQAIAMEATRPSVLASPKVPWLTASRLTLAGTSLAAVTVAAFLAFHSSALAPNNTHHPVGIPVANTRPTPLPGTIGHKPVAGPYRISKPVTIATIPSIHENEEMPIRHSMPSVIPVPVGLSEHETEAQAKVRDFITPPAKSNTKTASHLITPRQPHTGSMIAKKPTEIQLPGDNTGPVIAQTPTKVTAPEPTVPTQQIATTQVAESTEPAHHRNLFNALSLHASNAFSQPGQSVQPNQNQMQTVSYSAPGVSWVNSAIR